LCLRLPPNKMAVTVLFVFLTVAGLATGRYFNFHNNLGYRVWVGIQGNPGKIHPNNGGFQLDPEQPVSKELESCVCGTWSANRKKLHWGNWDYQNIAINCRLLSYQLYIFLTFHPLLKHSGPGSSVGIATGYGLDGPVIESRWGGENFRTRPDRPWGPPSLPYNGYRVLPGGKAAGVWC
jgi:hypothetical protein